MKTENQNKHLGNQRKQQQKQNRSQYQLPKQETNILKKIPPNWINEISKSSPTSNATDSMDLKNSSSRRTSSRPISVINYNNPTINMNYTTNQESAAAPPRGLYNSNSQQMFGGANQANAGDYNTGFGESHLQLPQQQQMNVNQNSTQSQNSQQQLNLQTFQEDEQGFSNLQVQQRYPVQLGQQLAQTNQDQEDHNGKENNNSFQNQLNFQKFLPKQNFNINVEKQLKQSSSRGQLRVKNLGTVNYDRQNNRVRQENQYQASQVKLNQLLNSQKQSSQKQFQNSMGNTINNTQNQPGTFGMMASASGSKVSAPSMFGSQGMSSMEQINQSLLEQNKQLMMQQQLLMQQNAQYTNNQQQFMAKDSDYNSSNHLMNNSINQRSSTGFNQQFNEYQNLTISNRKPNQRQPHHNQNYSVDQHQKKSSLVQKHQPYAQAADQEQRQRSNSKRTVKRIIKKKTLSANHSPQRDEAAMMHVDENGQIVIAQTHYEVVTTKYDKSGTKVQEQIKNMENKPKEFKDLNNSMKMLNKIKSHGKLSSSKIEDWYGVKVDGKPKEEADKHNQINTHSILAGAINKIKDKNGSKITQINKGDREVNGVNKSDVSLVSGISQMSGAGYLTNLMNPKNISSVQTMNFGDSHRNVYVNTVNNNNNPNEDTTKKKRKKIIIIKKKRHADGSVENTRQEIYKDYGASFAKKESQRLDSALDFYKGRGISQPKLMNNKGSIQIVQNRPVDNIGYSKTPTISSPIKQNENNVITLQNMIKDVKPSKQNQKGTKMTRNDTNNKTSEYDDNNKKKLDKHKSRNQKHNNITDISYNNGSYLTKKHEETFDLQPKVNPSNQMSSLQNDSVFGTNHQKYNKRKIEQEFQNNAVNAIFENGIKKEASQNSKNKRNKSQDIKLLNDTKDDIVFDSSETEKEESSKIAKRKKEKKKSVGGQNFKNGTVDKIGADDTARKEVKKVEESKKEEKKDTGRAPSPISATTFGYTFKLPKFDASVYIQFIDQLIFGSARKDAIMQPIPPAVGQLKFCIVRNKSVINKLTPSYYLYLEKNNGGKILVLYGKKMAFKKQSYYLISLEKNKSRITDKGRDADTCLGKLRALDGDSDKFVLYDNGENHNQKGVQFRDLRKEHGAFVYRYEPCNVGNIRKMIIIFPAITCINLQGNKDFDSDDAMTHDHKTAYRIAGQTLERSPKNSYNPGEREENLTRSAKDAISIVAPSQYDKGLGVKGNRDHLGREVPDSSKYLYTYVDWRPTNDKEGLLACYESNKGKNTKFKIFVDNPPQWNPKTNTYVYDFKGRVTEPSIKNFQLIPEVDGHRGETLNEFVLQFGKREKDEFIIDIQFPLSIYQGFGLALSAFDTD